MSPNHRFRLAWESLTAPQRALADFLRVDADLLAVAAEASRPLAEASNDPRALATYIAGIAVGEKDRLVASGKAARARMELLRGFGEPSADQHTGSSSLRTVAHLLDTTAERHRQRGQ
ncbi:MAG: hypothetical protein ACRDNF_12465 [Streptosporangiaceae bacterium]